MDLLWVTSHHREGQTLRAQKGIAVFAYLHMGQSLTVRLKQNKRASHAISTSLAGPLVLK